MIRSPHSIKRWVGKQFYSLKSRRKQHILRRNILRHYRKNPPGDPESAHAVACIRERGSTVFPAVPEREYNERTIEVATDPASGYPFVTHEGKRLFFPVGWKQRRIRRACAALLREQDFRSPHRYLTPSFDVGAETVLFDVGCAEGILTLSVIERVAAAHLFEASEEWAEPLRLTFEPWKEKVRIVPNYVSDTDDGQNVSLDTYTEGMETRGILLKLDVEGAEARVLAGGAKLLASPGVRAVVCTYHRAEDLEQLTALLRGKGYTVEPSTGYMLFLWDPQGLRPPYFRRGVIRCEK